MVVGIIVFLFILVWGVCNVFGIFGGLKVINVICFVFEIIGGWFFGIWKKLIKLFVCNSYLKVIKKIKKIFGLYYLSFILNSYVKGMVYFLLII